MQQKKTASSLRRRDLHKLSCASILLHGACQKHFTIHHYVHTRWGNLGGRNAILGLNAASLSHRSVRGPLRSASTASNRYLTFAIASNLRTTNYLT